MFLESIFNKLHVLFTSASTVILALQRKLLCFATKLPDLRLFPRDVRQTYAQPERNLAKIISTQFCHTFKSLLVIRSFQNNFPSHSRLK